MTSRQIALYGTDEALPKTREFVVGELRFSLEAGGIRHLRYRNCEVIRGIQYLLRDANWATPPLELDPPAIVEKEGNIEIKFQGRVHSGDIRFQVQARIDTPTPDSLRFRVSGQAVSAFVSNRIGFTILHPTPECENQPVVVSHLDGEKEDSRFPLPISPAQPVFDIAGLEYIVAGKVNVHCRLDSLRPGGRVEPYEMEDQRNWSDASYKTYVGTLLEPLPFDVAEGDRFEQEIVIRCEPVGRPVVGGGAAGDGVRLSIADADGGRLPPLGLALPEGGGTEALDHVDAIAIAAPAFLTAYLSSDSPTLDGDAAALEKLSRQLECDIDLEIELAGGDPREELSRMAAACRNVNLGIASVLPCPREYLRSYQPTAQWPDVPPLQQIYTAAREGFTGSLVGGGMLSYFTELNRKWPPADAIDFVSHTLTPIVHAADDRTVMENLSPISAMAATIQAQVGELPYRLGPFRDLDAPQPLRGGNHFQYRQRPHCDGGPRSPRMRVVRGGLESWPCPAGAAQRDRASLPVRGRRTAQSVVHRGQYARRRPTDLSSGVPGLQRSIGACRTTVPGRNDSGRWGGGDRGPCRHRERRYGRAVGGEPRCITADRSPRRTGGGAGSRCVVL